MTAPKTAEAFPPGQHLRDELDARGWTQADFAAILDRPVQLVSEIITGKKEITRETAAQIGAALGTSAEFWRNLQDSYHLWRLSHDAAVQRKLDDVRSRAHSRGARATAPRVADLPVGSVVATDMQAWIKYDDDRWTSTGDDMPTFNWDPQEALDGGSARVLRVGAGGVA